jgi:Protein of unknown function (DUF1552)
MMIFKKAIPRRLFLKGVGTTLALPLLDSMVPAFAKPAESGQPAIRLAVCYGPNGRIMKKWTPQAEGPLSAEISPTLAPLASVRDQLVVLTGLDIKIADPLGNESGGVHARPAAGFLTGLHAKPGDSVGISLDQYVAKHYGEETQLGSLEMSLDSSQFAPDDGAYSSYYMHAISWRTGTAPLPMEHNPRVIFERLFGDSDTTDPAERLRRAQDRKSILDSVTQGVANLLGGVGPGDRTKLDEYLEAIRDIERRIQVAEKGSAATEEPTTTMERPVGIPITFPEYARLMFDLQVVAFQADLTRVITFMFGREQTDRNFPEIGIGDGHHPLSHHKGVAEQIALVEKIDLHHINQVAYFFEKMRATPDGDGSLLDHSIIILGSGLSDANFHIHYNVPVVVAGGAAGQIKGGRHLRYEGTPLTNLHLALLDMMKIPAEGFLEGKQTDATGKLERLSLV